MIPKLLTIREAARALHVHEKTIRRRIQSGAIPATRIPGRSGYELRVKEDDVKAYLEREQ